MTTTILIEKYSAFMVSNPEFEPLIKEFILDLKNINVITINLPTEVETIDPELLTLK